MLALDVDKSDLFRICNGGINFGIRFSFENGIHQEFVGMSDYLLLFNFSLPLESCWFSLASY